ncbi:MAG: hypothetical protein KDD66_03180 [Bdellovibrionales bacterium]|nr:hypothetical protein [Bdellovibrionales bacterium]
MAQTSEPNRSKWDKVLGKQRKRAPKQTVRRPTSESAGEPKGIQFNHKLNLNSMAQLPSIVELDMPTDSDIRTNMAQIRALMVLDGRLLTLPLRYDQHFDAFVAQLPTPKDSLQYQFQLIRKDGSTVLSDTYAVNPSCDEELNRLLDKNSEKFSGQRSLALDATRKLEDIHRMNYLINTIKNLVRPAPDKNQETE